MKLDRVIFASDLNANYIQFWPLVSRVWLHVTGAKPTLFFIAPANTPIERVPGSEIIFIAAPPELPVCFVAQTVRLLAPSWFPNETCVISDIDLMVVRRDFFPRHLARCGEDALVILNRYTSTVNRPSMCYHVAKGRTFAEVFNIPVGPKSSEQLWAQMRAWHKRGSQWTSDEVIMDEACKRFQHRWPNRFKKVFTPHLWADTKHSVTHYTGFQFNASRAAEYIEIEPPFPYLAHRAVIHNALSKILPQFPLNRIQVLQKGVVKKNRHPHKNPNGRILLRPARTRVVPDRPISSRLRLVKRTTNRPFAGRRISRVAVASGPRVRTLPKPRTLTRPASASVLTARKRLAVAIRVVQPRRTTR